MKKFSVKVDERVLEASESGDAGGYPVFFLHPTPGSRVMLRPQEEHAAKHGVRLISYSRPGYSGSSRQPGRKVADGALDVISIADHLGIDIFSVLGYAEGGPHALSAAALAPDRVRSAATISSYAPFDAPGLDFYSGMGEFSRQDFKLLVSDEDKWDSSNMGTIETIRQSTKDQIGGLLKSMYTDADAAVVSDDLIEYMIGSVLDGCSVGINGVRDDRQALTSPWGFDPKSIRIPIQIWHGSLDSFVPLGHGKWLSSSIRGAESHFEESEGHLSVFVNNLTRVQEWLASDS